MFEQNTRISKCATAGPSSSAQVTQALTASLAGLVCPRDVPVSSPAHQPTLFTKQEHFWHLWHYQSKDEWALRTISKCRTTTTTRLCPASFGHAVVAACRSVSVLVTVFIESAEPVRIVEAFRGRRSCSIVDDAPERRIRGRVAIVSRGVFEPAHHGLGTLQRQSMCERVRGSRGNERGGADRERPGYSHRFPEMLQNYRLLCWP